MTQQTLDLNANANATATPDPDQRAKRPPYPNQITKEQYDQIHRLAAQGLNQKQIADETKISRFTVKRHLNKPQYTESKDIRANKDSEKHYQRHLLVRAAQGVTSNVELQQELKNLGFNASQTSAYRYAKKALETPHATLRDLAQAITDPSEVITPEYGMTMRAYRTWQHAAEATGETQEPSGFLTIRMEDMSSPQHRMPQPPQDIPPKSETHAVLTEAGNLFLHIQPPAKGAVQWLHVGNIPQKDADIKQAAQLLAQLQIRTFPEVTDYFAQLASDPPRLTNTAQEQPHQPATGPAAAPQPEHGGTPPETSEATATKETSEKTSREQEDEQQHEQVNPDTNGTIAKAWENLNAHLHMDRGQLEKTAHTALQELAALSEVELHHEFTTVTLKKQHVIFRCSPRAQTKESPDTFIIENASNTVGVNITIGAAKARDGTPGVRDAHFPDHIHWWRPEEGPQPPWLLRAFRQDIMSFLKAQQPA